MAAKTLPSLKIEKLAKHALADPAFRKKASKKGGFHKAVNDELANPALGFKKISEAELAFCEGWLHMARRELGTSFFDEKLVIAINEELATGQFTTQSG